MKHAAAIHAVPVKSIVVKNRHRRDMGDLSELASSVERDGLLQPIGITEENVLVFGERRLRAVRDLLKRPTIEARIVRLKSIIDGEHAENELRKDFTPSERVAIAETIAKALGNRQGQRTDKKQLQDNCPEVPRGVQTRDVAAQKAGFSNVKDYERARKVVTKAAEEVVARMDSGDLSISAAASIADKPKAEQIRIVELPAPERQEALRAARERLSKEPESPKLRGLKEGDSERYGAWTRTFEWIAKRELPPDQLAALILDFDPDGRRVRDLSASVEYLTKVKGWVGKYEVSRKQQVG